ncbi:holo-ACP synthase [Pseudalkalibacillus hwajinpoensis]|uniref:holo-ACP synthase n=1 Tax=Guptibacillus hwajinpoensis TaxID=208199 RepID=UPI001CFD3D2E|nr:holo-ACP synthase [Pseudalkalibacillus hwajinpoensis]
MIKGIGIDMIELERIKKAVKRNDSFAKRILTESELGTYHLLTGHRSIEFLAGRFAAKEAYAKARGTGIGKLSWQDICVLKSVEGAPYIETKDENEIVHISISHTKEHAVAQIVIECSSS